MKFIAYGIIQKDEMKLKNPDRFKKFLTALRFKAKDETPIKLTIERDIKRRTQGADHEPSNQNGYYWSVVIPILSEHFGYLPDEVHLALKFKFLRNGGSENLPKFRSTSSINKHEWEDLMEKIRIWALSDFDIKIPLPNEVK